MDVRTEDSYPVYLINENYGGRALDYRAAKNNHGICMLICNAFRDKRTRIQHMMRICRHTDNGMYIQGNDVKDIDKKKFLKYKAVLMNAHKEIEALIPIPEVLEGQQESQVQNEDKDKDYAATMIAEQNDLLQGKPSSKETLNMQENLTKVK